MRILKFSPKKCLKKKCFKETWQVNDDFDGHCCGPMSAAVRMCDVGVDYDKSIRRYDFSMPGRFLEKSNICVGLVLYFCPWCSKELPKDLLDEWAAILEKEYGIDSPYDRKQKRLIPKEYRTDEWWKGRGL
jgi:hypothetical protein